MEEKKNPVIKIDWGELRNRKPGKGAWTGIFIIVGLLIVIYWGLGYLDERINFYSAAIEVKEEARVKAEEAQEVAEAAKDEVAAESAEKDAAAEREINRLRRGITTLRREVTGLQEENIGLQEGLSQLPAVIDASSDEELATSIPPLVAELYPLRPSVLFGYDPVTGLFNGDRSFANAVRLSFEETASLRIQLTNSQSILDLRNGEVTSLNFVIAQEQEKVKTWKELQGTTQVESDARLVTIDALTGERDAWEDKSNAQSRRLFLYKWGTRIGVGAAVMFGIYAAGK